MSEQELKEVDQLIEQRKRFCAKQDAELTQLRAERGCACLYVDPCSENCSCAHPMMSGGCQRCCAHGSDEQKVSAAKTIVSNELEMERLRTGVARLASTEPIHPGSDD